MTRAVVVALLLVAFAAFEPLTLRSRPTTRCHIVPVRSRSLTSATTALPWTNEKVQGFPALKPRDAQGVPMYRGWPPGCTIDLVRSPSTA